MGHAWLLHGKGCYGAETRVILASIGLDYNLFFSPVNGYEAVVLISREHMHRLVASPKQRIAFPRIVHLSTSSTGIYLFQG